MSELDLAALLLSALAVLAARLAVAMLRGETDLGWAADDVPRCPP